MINNKIILIGLIIILLNSCSPYQDMVMINDYIVNTDSINIEPELKIVAYPNQYFVELLIELSGSNNINTISIELFKVQNDNYTIIDIDPKKQSVINSNKKNKLEYHGYIKDTMILSNPDIILKTHYMLLVELVNKDQIGYKYGPWNFEFNNKEGIANTLKTYPYN